MATLDSQLLSPPVARGRGWMSARRLINLPALALLACLILAVELIARSGTSPAVPSATGVIAALPEVLGSEAFWTGVGQTMLAVLLGTAVGLVFGVALGLFVGRFIWLRAVLNPYISGLNAMPMLALIPLVTIWLGYSPDARFAMIVLSASLPVMISTSDGAQKTPAALDEVMTVLRVGKLRRMGDLVLPATVPYIVAGANVAIGRAVIAAVSVEFMASVAGLGTFILTNSRSFNADAAFIGIITIAIAGLALRWLVERASGLVFPWYRASGASAR